MALSYSIKPGQSLVANHTNTYLSNFNDNICGGIIDFGVSDSFALWRPRLPEPFRLLMNPWFATQIPSRVQRIDVNMHDAYVNFQVCSDTAHSFGSPGLLPLGEVRIRRYGLKVMSSP